MRILLKDFLTVLPSPKCIEEVLLTAIYQLAEIDLKACRWILCNSHYLQPSLDLVEVAKKFALTKLENQGFLVEEDFRFDPNGYLQVKKRALTGLIMGNSAGDTLCVKPRAYRLLLPEILQGERFHLTSVPLLESATHILNKVHKLNILHKIFLLLLNHSVLKLKSFIYLEKSTKVM